MASAKAARKAGLSRELRSKLEAREVVPRLRVRHKVVRPSELSAPKFASNPPRRCYHCKKELFGKLKRMAAQEGIRSVLDGSNFDDRLGFRPGAKAAAGLGVRSPLREARLTTDDIRG